jgi:hypothetical protein
MSEQRSKPPHALLLNALYDRITTDFASRRWQALVNGSPSQSIDEWENALRLVWCSYIDFAVGAIVRPAVDQE